jgi:hypothetical protein
MPHITFIHGIGNKPQPNDLCRIWLHALEAGDGLRLGSNNVTCSMVYWADLMYHEPADEDASEESVGPEAVTEPKDDDDAWRADLPPEESAFVAEIAEELRFSMPRGANDAFVPDPGQNDGSFERIPLPWFVKRRLMKILLRDVHHYLFNATSAPRVGEAYEVQTEIRRRVVDTLKRDAANNSGGPHIVVSHSMGTVIAYDCLMRVTDCPPVDGLITVGSPLGLDEIQDKLQPEWSRINGFPRSKIRTDWTNVYDALDPVAAADPRLGNDFMASGTIAIEDIHQPNAGLWRHDITKYLGGSLLRDAVARQLQVRWQ